MNVVTKAINQAISLKNGQGPLASLCRVTPAALVRWRNLGRFPRTDFTGETNYAGKVASITGLDREKLMQASAIVWKQKR